MSKHGLLVTAIILSLWAGNVWAQERILTIDELFRLTDENSKSIQISQTALREASQAVATAKTNRLPSVYISLSASYMGNGRVWDRDFTGGMKAPIPHFGNNFSIEASQVIYGGAIGAAIERAELQRQIAELNVQDNSQNIRFLVLGYYLELYKLNNQAEVYRKNIGQAELLLRQIRARRAEGVALQNDITRYELQLEQLRLGLTELQNNAAILNFHLVSTLALPEGTVIRPDSTLLATKIPGLDRQEWQRQAESSRPALQIAELAVSLGRRQERITRAERLPKVALVAANHLTGPVTIEIPALNKNFNYWYVGIGVQYSLGSLWKSRSKSRMDRYATIRARQSFELAREETEIAVNSADIMLRQAFEQVRTQEKSVDLAMQNYTVINNRYLNDLALLTDMIDASNQQLSAELSLANARVNVIYNYYKLKRVAGTL